MKKPLIGGKAAAEYVRAFTEIIKRIEADVAEGARRLKRPIAMYVAGGAAQMFYTGTRVTRDIDAAFSHRVKLSDDLEIGYRDASGQASLLFLDRQYNETFGLIHENAHDDAIPLALTGVDPQILDVRLFSPLDLAVSKIARLADHDRADIASLAAHGLITADAVRRRAEEAVLNYVGNMKVLATSIKLACDLVREHQRPPASRTRAAVSIRRRRN